MSEEKGPSVAVLGLGALGLVAMKNMREEGFNVTGFDRNPYVGGLWHYSEGSNISVLQSTVSNGSKHRGCFTDFPFPDETPDFPRAADMAKYLVSYAEHFGLMPHAQLSTNIHRAEYIEKTNNWEVETSPVAGGPRVVARFDKVIYAMGPDQIPNIPQVPGIEKFKGDTTHSIGFKEPQGWTGKRVLVVGFGNTAADIAGDLVGVAKHVYLSHRGGAIVLPRWVDGKPVDHVRTHRKAVLLGMLSRYAPGLWKKTMDKVILGLRNRVYDLKPEWRLDPAPSFNQQRPIVSDSLVRNFSKGHITSACPIKEVLDDKTIQLSDDTKVEVDAIIWCTGYTVDYSLLGKSNPTLYHESEGIPVANGRKMPRLYQNVISLEHPESLAFMGNLSFMNPAFLMFDIASMALAQIWKGRSRLPSKEEMRQSVDDQHKWIASLCNSGPVTPGLVKGVDWMEWVDQAAGLGLQENLGYGMQGWYFWLTDHELCNMVMDGLLLPFHYRLFDAGKRKPWKEARESIIKVNQELRAKNWYP
ncbi:dimethylaniline monooxygenase 3 [Aspergillus steynii IBT 23096]|uniref:Dimethylaniline monooxygenase 3 n=1 Tax=Aspergillus steynii IBT 23096 TaxID=1392250 RepID=A0A2I2G6F0_9EURO|nr:dimethylaniline monooxygenase 3 [Aspergillus steynii IBT 23096]PLB48451.1 dimethylaniline monooxygenase 3 [Aspergillus steynii IBT 23096]